MEREMDLRGKEAVSLSSLVKQEYQIPDSYYFGEVKRGLRNSDGTGVLIGVTKVGSVQGYLIEDGRRIPVPGKLYYRGIDLNEIVEAHRKSGTFGYEEVAYLLLMGHLPTKSELSYFNDIMCRARNSPEGFTEGMIMRHPSRDIMNDLARSVRAALLLRRKSRRYFGGEPAHTVHQAHWLVPGDRCKRLRSEPPLF